MFGKDAATDDFPALSSRIGDGVLIPTWLLASFLGFVGGMVLGPAMMASTEAGSAKLAELSRQYVGGRK